MAELAKLHVAVDCGVYGDKVIVDTRDVVDNELSWVLMVIIDVKQDLLLFLFLSCLFIYLYISGLMAVVIH